MDVKIIIAIVLVLLSSSVAAFLMLQNTKKKDADPPMVVAPAAPAPAVAPAVAPAPALAPPPTSAPPSPSPSPTPRPDVMLYSPALVSPPGWYPRMPLFPPHAASHYLPVPRPIQPGGAWPELMNRDKDDAVAYVMSTYPNMHVVVVRYGAPMPSDARADRFIIVYDAWTRKVVGASIG